MKIISFIIHDQSSSPGADDYIIDADRSTLRLSTGYPIDLSRRSSKNEDGKLPLKNPAEAHIGDICSNWPEIAIPVQKINIDNKNCFGDKEGNMGLYLDL